MSPEERLNRIEGILEKQSREIDKHNAAIDKHNAAIRDLIVASRTVLTAVEENSVQIKELRDAQAATDEKLNILIDTVDRIVRNRNGKE